VEQRDSSGNERALSIDEPVGDVQADEDQWERSSRYSVN